MEPYIEEAGFKAPDSGSPLLEPRDLLLFFYLPLLVLIAWCVPERVWPPVIHAFVRLSVFLKLNRIASMEALLEDLFDRPLPFDARTLIEAQRVASNIARLEILRCHRPGGWQPKIRLEGRGYLEQALAAGQGAVLWVMPMVHTYLVTKMAISQAGFDVSHLSRVEHGSYGNSWLGVRLFNWIETTIERRYVAERLVISENQTSGSLRALTKRLRANGIVSITVGGRGRRWHEVPFLRGRIRIAAGAPALALRANAALLPVFTVQQEDGSFVTKIEPPLVSKDSGRSAAAERALTSLYAEVASDYAFRYPVELDFAMLRLSSSTRDPLAGNVSGTAMKA